MTRRNMQLSKRFSKIHIFSFQKKPVGLDDYDDNVDPGPAGNMYL